MARPRSELNDILENYCQEVYFQPPASKKLSYPCIIYKLDRLNVVHADNVSYRVMDEYSVTYITRDPDDPNIRAIALLPYCELTRAYPSDNLHHNSYRLYF